MNQQVQRIILKPGFQFPYINTTQNTVCTLMNHSLHVIKYTTDDMEALSNLFSSATRKPVNIEIRPLPKEDKKLMLSEDVPVKIIPVDVSLTPESINYLKGFIFGITENACEVFIVAFNESKV